MWRLFIGVVLIAGFTAPAYALDNELKMLEHADGAVQNALLALQDIEPIEVVIWRVHDKKTFSQLEAVRFFSLMEKYGLKSKVEQTKASLAKKRFQELLPHCRKMLEGIKRFVDNAHMHLEAIRPTMTMVGLPPAMLNEYKRSLMETEKMSNMLAAAIQGLPR